MIFSIMKATEGGMGQKTALELLKDAGIKAEKATSIYVGHTAVLVRTENKRTLARTERILYGRY